MFRHYQDVISSKLKKFNSEVSYLEAIVNRESSDWRSEGVSDEVHEIVSEYYSPDMMRSDAAGLAWYARNVLFFEQSLGQSERVLLCNYADLVAHPEDVIERIYSFIGLRPPSASPGGQVFKTSVGKGQDVKLSPEIQLLCSSLFEQLLLLQQSYSVVS